MKKTIYALATAPGRAGVQIVRVSGAEADNILRIFSGALPAPREAALLRLCVPDSQELIDEALVLRFVAPHSYTGENVVEFHLHGGRATLQAMIKALEKTALCRPARQGEFTRRAFENGKMDLTEAEAIADLIDAETEAQRRQAVRQLEGELGALYKNWGARLKKILAHSEAAIDFSDEELPEDLEQKQQGLTENLVIEIQRHLSDNNRGERLREGFVVAILGAPNAGKSSLLNALAAQEAAIVSPIAGTTRDIIEVKLDLAGYPVTLADTAGLRDSVDALESEGIRRALARAQNADFKILVYDGSAWPVLDMATQALADEASLRIINKVDLLALRPENELLVSTKTGDGLEELKTRLIQEIEKRFVPSASPVITRARHRDALQETVAHLVRSGAAREAALRAEDIRLAMRALGSITGQVDVEDLLDTIFRDFCIGK